MNRLITSLLLFAAFSAGAAEQLPFPRPSSFDSRRISRDPFTPLEELGTADKTLLVEAVSSNSGNKFDMASLFRVSSISIARLSIAIINAKAFAEGESFDMRGEGKEIKRVTVLKISDGSVTLDYSGYKIDVPLTRKEAKVIEE